MKTLTIILFFDQKVYSDPLKWVLDNQLSMSEKPFYIRLEQVDNLEEIEKLFEHEYFKNKYEVFLLLTNHIFPKFSGRDVINKTRKYFPEVLTMVFFTISESEAESYVDLNINESCVVNEGVYHVYSKIENLIDTFIDLNYEKNNYLRND